jgi:hypothetical protein
MTAVISQEQKQNSAPMSQFEGAAEMGPVIKKNQHKYYPRAKPVAPPLVLGNPVVDGFFLSTIEGKFVASVCKWLVQQGQVAEGKIAKMYEVINRYLARGTCAGQAKTFLLHRRLEQYDGQVQLQEKVSSVFFQACQKLETDIERFCTATKRKQRKNAQLLFDAHKNMDRLQKKVKNLAEEYWNNVSPHDSLGKAMEIGDKVDRLVNQEKRCLKKISRVFQKIRTLKRKELSLSKSREEAENQLKKLSSTQQEYWKEKQLGVIARASYARQATQEGFSFFAAQKVRELTQNQRHESLYMVMEYDKSTAHAILFQPSRSRVFDLQAGVVEYASQKDFFRDFKKYLIKTRCYRVVISAIGTISGRATLEIV